MHQYMEEPQKVVHAASAGWWNEKAWGNFRGDQWESSWDGGSWTDGSYKDDGSQRVGGWWQCNGNQLPDSKDDRRRSDAWWGGQHWHQEEAYKPWDGVSQEGCEDWIQDAEGHHRCTLIWFHSCHGRPDNGWSVVDDLVSRGEFRDHVRVVSPCAPRRPRPMTDEGSFQWFEYTTDHLADVTESCGTPHQDDGDEVQLVEQRSRLLQLVEDEVRRLPRDGWILLGGLSQGVSMALDVLLHLSDHLCARVRGVIAKRGTLQDETLRDVTITELQTRLAAVTVLATHGTDDDMVPMWAARRSYEFLVRCGVSLDFRSFAGLRHLGYSEEEADAIARFCGQMFGEP